MEEGKGNSKKCDDKQQIENQEPEVDNEEEEGEEEEEEEEKEEEEEDDDQRRKTVARILALTESTPDLLPDN